MKITNKNTVKDLKKFAFLLDHSDTQLMDEVKKFELPEKVGKYPVKDYNEISISDMLLLWDIQYNEQLIKLAGHIFLGVTDIKKLYHLPLIDFLRLNVHLEQVSKMAANKFKELERQNNDPKIRKILAKYKGSDFGIIARFCKLFPIYTLEEAKNISWVIVYKAFEEETKSNDIQTEIQEAYK